LIQNTQNREAKATQLKLDELIRAVQGARDSLVDLEDGPEEEFNSLQREFRELRRQALLQQARERGMTRVIAASRVDYVDESAS
jgi:low affinity Fe/Cu permease